MDRLVTSLVFCEAPVDFAYGGGGAAGSVGTGAKLAVDARAGGDVSSSRPAEETAARHVSANSAQRQVVECAPAFDGLNCFETVVMPSR